MFVRMQLEVKVSFNRTIHADFEKNIMVGLKNVNV